MAASMNFRPEGYDDDDDFDDDGFFLDCPRSVNNSNLLNAHATNQQLQPTERGGFGVPQPKQQQQNIPAKQYKRSSDKQNEAETWSLGMGDFHMAVVRNQIDAIKQALDSGFLVDTVLRSGWTGLMYAASHGSAELVKIFLDKGANPNYHKDKYTVLMAGCGAARCPEAGVLECVNLLLERGSQVNEYDRYHTTALIYAAREGRSQVIGRLVEHGANVNKQDSRGWTALTWAVSKNYTAAVRSLLQNGANPHLKHCDNQSVIDMAEVANQDEMLEILTGRKPSIPSRVEKVTDGSGEKNNTSYSRVREDKGKTFEELELFLSGLNLHHLIDVFHTQHVDFNIFLRMSEADLLQMGITEIGHRKKILDGIAGVHKKDWETTSLPQFQDKSRINCAEAIALVANISKHTKYIATTIGYLEDQVKIKPAIVEELKDGVGPKQLQLHITDTLKNIGMLEHRLSSLKQVTEKTLKDGNYDPPDIITKTKENADRRSRLYLPVVVLAGAAIVVIVWNRKPSLDGLLGPFLHREVT